MISETDHPARESVGERIRRLRHERGLSQRQISGPGFSYAYISRIEAGARQPSVKALRKIAAKLGVSPEFLETGEELAPSDEREIRLSNAELELRLADDPTAAEEALRAVLADAEAARDGAAATRARAALGSAALRRGDHATAVAELERVVASGRVSPLWHADVYATLGRAYVASGAPLKGVEFFEGCLAEVQQRAPDNRAAYARFATYLSYALSDAGDIVRAREVLRGAVADRDDAADPYTRVRLYWSQARLAAAEDDAPSALANLRRAIALLETTEDVRQLARAHLLYAEILTFDGETDGAAPHLELAEQLLGPHPDAEDLYWLRAEQARRAAAAREADEAIARANEALALIGDTDPAERGTAYWALGEGLAARGDIDGAIDAFARSVDLLSAHRVWREAAKACQTWARALRNAGREGEAFDVLERAADLAVRAGSPARVSA